MNILAKAAKTISIYDMIAPKDKILVGVSGGPDSVCLLDILNRMALRQGGLKLYVAHLNHGLRGRESDKEQIFCRKLAGEMGIPFIAERVRLKKRKGSLEEEARRIRYRFLEDNARKIKAGKIALGHNADDQAETVLMRILRGAGARGMSGIPPARKTEGGFLVVRPLMGISREEILAYLKKRRLKYCVDSSNKQMIFLRNKIRHKLIPLLGGYNPRIKKILQTTGTNMALIDDYIQKQVEREFSVIASVSSGKVLLDITKIKKLHPALQKEIIRRAIITLGSGLVPSAVVVDNILALMGEKQGSKRIRLSAKIEIVREYKTLVVNKQSGNSSRGEYNKILPVPGQIAVNAGNIIVTSRLYRKGEIADKVWKRAGRRNVFEVYLDYDSILKPLSIRNWKPGDRFCPLGFAGTRKVQDIFTDAKIPVRLREKVPLVVSGKDICWIAGYRIGNKFRIKPDTEKILRINIKGMDEIWLR